MSGFLLTVEGSRLLQEDGSSILLDLNESALMDDLDQGGNVLQRTKIYLGPSLGWVEGYINPARFITAGGPTDLVNGDCVIFVNIAATVTLNLPDINQVLKQFPQRSQIGTFGEYYFIKDFGGNAAAFNITIHPFAGQKIDGLATDFIIGQNRQLLRLYPLADATGWA
jgi:hypothetical protein